MGQPSAPSPRCVLFVELAEVERLVAAAGAARAGVLQAELLEAVAAAVRRSGGRVALRLGPELIATFADPREALLGAVAVQECVADVRRRHADRPPLALSLGLDHGEVVLDGERVSGPGVYAAKRLAEAAGPEQVLLSEAALRAAGGLGLATRDLGERRLRGHEHTTRLHQLLWNDAEATTVRPRPAGEESPARALVLVHGGRELRLEPGGRLTLGRSAEVDCPVDEEGVSRRHATLSVEDGRFFLRDHSTNGTWVLREGEVRPIHLRDDELRLRDEGTIGLGAEPERGAAHTLAYRHER